MTTWTLDPGTAGPAPEVAPGESPADLSALDRWQTGQAGGFDELYLRYYGPTVRYCEHRLRDRYEAEDVAQEAFERAWRAISGFGGERNFAGWLRVIAANLCTDAIRRRARSLPVTDIDGVVADDASAGLEALADRQMVRDAFSRLNTRHRSALAMRETEGLSYEEIASRTGVSLGTVESLLWRARGALRREFAALSARDAVLVLLPVLALALRRAAAHGRSVAARLARWAVPGPDSPVAPVAHAARLAAGGVLMLGSVAGSAAVLNAGHPATPGPAHVVSPQPAPAPAGVGPAPARPLPPPPPARLPSPPPAPLLTAGSPDGAAAPGVVPPALPGPVPPPPPPGAALPPPLPGLMPAPVPFPVLVPVPGLGPVALPSGPPGLLPPGPAPAGFPLPLPSVPAVGLPVPGLDVPAPSIAGPAVAAPGGTPTVPVAGSLLASQPRGPAAPARPATPARP